MPYMKKLPNPHSRRAQAGFSLIEILVSILLCTIGLLGLVGLQTRAVQYTVASEDISRAAKLANEAVFAIQNQRSVPLASVDYAAWQALVRNPAVGFAYGEGEILAPDANGIVRIIITWTPPDSPTERRYVTEVAVSL